MNVRRARSVVALGLCAGALACERGVAPGDTGPPAIVAVADPAHREAIAAGRAFVERVMEAYEIPGLTLAVGADGALVWAEARGYADVEARRPLEPETPLRVHSVSKALTAFAVGVLVDEGRLDLDAPIQRYVPTFPVKEGEITVRSLGGHLAGIRHYERDEEVLNQRRFVSAVESLEPFADDPLLHPPGSRYAYSSYGWNLIGAAVESVCAAPFPDCMDGLVISPLGLAHTSLEGSGEPPSAVTYYERTAAGQLVQAPSFNTSNRWPAGGMLSTPSDLVRFALAFLDDERVSAATREILLSEQLTTSGQPVPYGIGWSLAAGPGGTPVAYHQGGSTGGISFLALLPEHRFAFAMIANVNGELGDAEPPLDLALRALQLFLGA